VYTFLNVVFILYMDGIFQNKHMRGRIFSLVRSFLLSALVVPDPKTGLIILKVQYYTTLR
jgi:hypothetical protein